MQTEYEKMSDSEKKKEDWMNSKWRPMMGWMYMLVCTMDFVVFPILWSLVQTMHGGQVSSQWNPITLQGAGLFHMAMGAILGIAAFGRTQEKLAGANNTNGYQTPAINNNNGYQPSYQPTYSRPQQSYSAPTNAPMQPNIAFSSTGKAMPEQPPMPLI